MAEYLPPTEDLPIFNSSLFISQEDPISIGTGDSRYLRFPTSQGSETINGNLTTTGNSITNGNTTTSGQTNTNTIESIAGTLNIQTSGIGNIEMGLDTATSGNTVFRGQNINFIAYNSVQIEATNAYWTNIGQGNFYYRGYNGIPTIIMGNQTTSVDYFYLSADVGSTTLQVYSGDLNHNSSLGAVNMNAATTINLLATTSVEIQSTTNINTTTTQNTAIGNATGTISMRGAQLRPIEIGTYASQSSYSTSSSTPVRTYLGGTLSTTNTFTNWATTALNYVMASISPYNAAGGVSLTAGTYMVAFGFNADNTVAFTLSDIRMGIGSVSTLVSGSTEAQFVAGTFNRTCYFHRTDSTDAAASDTDNLGFTGMFRIGATTTVYPWLRLNTSVSPILDVIVDVIITKLGSG
jgi:hypothetical protein